jgi:hypothetical protein
MSIVNIAQLFNTHTKQTLNTFLWLTAKIDYNKLSQRILRAHMYPNEKVKCVLAEYLYTSRTYEALGNPNIVEYLPNSNVLIHHALNNPDFIRFMDKYFGAQPNKVIIHVRQKIKSDGTPDFHKKQLVITYEPWAFIERPVS